MTKRDQVQKEALNIALKNKRCGLGVSMGVGKTLIGLKYVDHMQKSNMGKLRVLVVAPKLSIFESWEDDGVKFNIDVSNIEFSTYLSLPKKNPHLYDVVVLDECHSLLPSSLSFLENYSGRILGLTGTPPRYKNSEKGELVARFCPILYKYITDEAVEDQILNDYRIFVHMLNLSDVPNIEVALKDKTFYTSEIKNYSYWCQRVLQATTKKQEQIASIMRMKALMNYKTKEEYAIELIKVISNKCIVFANTQEQADLLCKHSYHSNNPNSEENLEMFKSGSINLLSCVMQLNEGVNIPNLRSGIILHSYGNERKLSQRIGRLLRLNPDETSIVHILCYKKTADERWVAEALKDLDSSKIKYLEPDESPSR